MHALPVRHRRARNQAGSEQVRPQHGDHQCLVARLAVTDGERTRRVRMELDHALEEFHLSLDDVEELLAGRGHRAEADEIDRMARIQGIADLALRLEAADARPLAGARIDHHDRPLARIDRRSPAAARCARAHNSSAAAATGRSSALHGRSCSTVAIGRDVISISSLPRCRSRSRNSTLRWSASTMYSGQAVTMSPCADAKGLGKADNANPNGPSVAALRLFILSLFSRVCAFADVGGAQLRRQSVRLLN